MMRKTVRENVVIVTKFVDGTQNCIISGLN